MCVVPILFPIDALQAWLPQSRGFCVFHNLVHATAVLSSRYSLVRHFIDGTAALFTGVATLGGDFHCAEPSVHPLLEVLSAWGH